jgi:hypothetical protein
MALNSSVVWSLFPDGNELNGAGYDSALATASSVDFSQQAVAALSISDAAAVGTTNLSSVTGGFLATHVGNLVRITDGTLTSGFYAITARVDSNNVTLDRTPGNGSGSVVKVGGASKVGSNDIIFKNAVVSGNIIHAKDGGTGYTITVNGVTCLTASSATAPCQFIGYTTTRGDGGKVRFTLGTGAISFRNTGSFWVIKNVEVNANSTALIAISQEGTNNYLYNCVGRGATSSNYTDVGGVGGGGNVADACEFKNGLGDGATVGASSTNQWSGRLERCTIHGNAGSGVSCNNGNWTIERNYIYGNTLDGVTITNRYGHLVLNNVLSRNGRDGVRISSTDTVGRLYGTHIRRNVFNRNTGYQVNYSPSDISATQGASVWANHYTDCNSFYTTGSGVVHNLPTLANSLTLASDPFTDSSAGDFTVDSASAGGAQLLGTFCSVTLPDGNTITQVSGPYGIPTNAVTTTVRSRWRELTNERDSEVVPDLEVDDWVQSGADALNRRIDYHYTTDSNSVVLIEGTGEYELPEDCCDILWITHNGTFLQKRDMDDWQRHGEDWEHEENGTPREWCHFSNRLILRPPPDAASIAAAASPIFLFVSRPAAVGLNGLPQLAPQHHELPIVYGASLYLYCYPAEEMFEREAAFVKQEYADRKVRR